MNPRVLKCPSCGAPLTFRSPFCAYCRHLITWDRDLAIERGAPFFSLDFSRDHLPSSIERKPTRAGTPVVIDKLHWEHWGLFEPRLRDACVVIRAVASDDNGEFGVYARLNREGDGRSAYKLAVYPGRRAWKLSLEAWAGEHTDVRNLVPWEHAPAIADVGQPNEVELRLADSVLQVVLNGQHITTVFDASFGFGNIGWIAGSLDGPAKVTLQSAAAFRAV